MYSGFNTASMVPQSVPPSLIPPWLGHGNELTRNELNDLNQRLLGRVNELVNNVITWRNELRNRIGDPRRDIEKECGYPSITDRIPTELYQQLYERNSIAARVVELLPKECWQVTPEVYEDEDSEVITPFEEAWDELGKTLRGQYSWFKEEEGSPIWEILKRVDIQSGIGSYGVLLFGLNDGLPLSQPAKGWKEENSEATGKQETDDGTWETIEPSMNASSPKPYKLTINAQQTKGRKLLYLRAFPEHLAQVTQWETNFSSPRFGQPTMYQITLHDPRGINQGSIGAPNATLNVHWSRVLHIADNLTSNEVLGTPRMRPVLNSILGAGKIVCADPEMYWQAALPGLAFSTHPQLGGDVAVDRTKVRDAVEQYFNGLQRFLLGEGMGIQNLAPNVADPSPHIDKQIEMICILLGCPVRVFKGSERGELASSQDDAAWNDRLRERQRNYLTPRVVVPFIDRCILLGILPEPKALPLPKPKPSMVAGGVGPDGKPLPGKPALPGIEGKEEVEDAEFTEREAPGDYANESEEAPIEAGEGQGGTVEEEVLEEERVAELYDGEAPVAEGQVAEPVEDEEAVSAEYEPETEEELPTGPGQLAGSSSRPKSPDDLKGSKALMGGRSAKKGYCVNWPDLTSQTQTEKATVATQKATALSTYSQGISQLMTTLDFLTKIMGFDEEEAKSIIANAEKELLVKEQQAMEQQQALIDQGLAPDPTNPLDPITLKEGEMMVPNPNNPGAPQKPIANPKAQPSSGNGFQAAGKAGVGAGGNGKPPFGGRPKPF